jgi:hypothetical protein
MSEDSENFKLSSGSETPTNSSEAGMTKGSNTTPTTGAGSSVGSGGSVGAPEIGPTTAVWTSPPQQQQHVDDYYYYNSALNFQQQNGYFFQNFGPPPNMGKIACNAPFYLSLII